MRTAQVTRFDEFVKVSCCEDFEFLHALYFWHSDFSDCFCAFDFAIRSAEMFIDFGVVVPFVV